MSFTQHQKALSLLKKIREKGAVPAARPSLVTVATASAPSSQDVLTRAVADLYHKLKSRTIDEDTAERLVDECTELFERDRTRMEKICLGVLELSELKAAWLQRHKAVVEALDEALFAYFDGRDTKNLDQHFLKVKVALQQRIAQDARLNQLSIPTEQVA